MVPSEEIGISSALIKVKRTRKRADFDIEAKRPDPRKQRAGLLGVESRAKKRALSETGKGDSKGDSAEPATKKGKQEQISIENLPLIMNLTKYIHTKGRKFTVRYHQATIDERESL